MPVKKDESGRRWVAAEDEWDDQLEGWESGWPCFFRILRLYLRHFAGQSSSAFQVMGMAPAPRSEARAELTGALGVSGAEPGERVRGAGGTPSLAGLVEWLGAEDDPELLLRLDEPAPGIAHLFAMDMGGQVLLSLRVYLYGETAVASVEREEPRWQDWIGERFPSGGAEADG